jgi:hypothetical protein
MPLKSAEIRSIKALLQTANGLILGALGIARNGDDAERVRQHKDISLRIEEEIAACDRLLSPQPRRS